MKFLLSILVVIMVFFSSVAISDVFVKGYYRSDGAYVQPHYRSNPNSNPHDNWSTKGNTNPYTGKKGYKNPFQKQYQYQNRNYRTSPNWNR